MKPADADVPSVFGVRFGGRLKNCGQAPFVAPSVSSGSAGRTDARISLGSRLGPHRLLKATPSPAWVIPRRRGGFALLITITLLAFLVLLLVSLATLTRVETQVASNNQALTQARQNAQMALGLALGELQRLAGPDQRVTATADLGEPDRDGGTAHRTARNGLVAPREGARHWTGVWGNPSAPDAIYSVTPQPVLLNWLVSGNENAAVLADTDGHILSPSTTANSPATKPDANIPALAGATALSDLGNWRLLVGPGSVEQTTDYVAAPLMDIEASGLPGFAATESHPVGRYAWWVGDEGVKARYDLRDRHAAAGDATMPDPGVDAASRWRLSVAQRDGVERITDLAGYPVNASSLDSVRSLAQIALPAPSVIGQTALKRHFHDLTVASEGVLADSQRGGLRRDLSYYLAQGGLSGSILPTAASAFPGADVLKGPTWGLLKSFHDEVAAAAAGSGLEVVPGNATTHGISPVIVQLRNQISLYVDATRATYLRLKPLIVLGNPYTVPLSAPLGVDFRYSSEPQDFSGSLAWELWTGLTAAGQMPSTDAAVNTANGWTRRLNLPLLTQATSSNPRSIFGQFILRSPPFTLAPGELIVFTLKGSATRGNPNTVVGYDLVANNPDPTLYLQLSSGVTGINAADYSTATVPRYAILRPQGGGFFHFGMYRRTADGSLPAVEETLGAEPKDMPINDRLLQRLDRVGWETRTTADQWTQWFEMPLSGTIIDRHIVSSAYVLQLPHDASPGRRPFADRNLRAQRVRGTPLMITGNWSLNDSTFMEDTDDLRWGSSLTASGEKTLVLFDLLQAQDADTPLLSLGALQHADLTADRTGFPTTLQPGYALGNSWASPYVPRDKSADTRITKFGGEQIHYPTGGTPTEQSFYDISYLLNDALWDSSFFSTVPQGASATLPAVLPNGRLRPLTSDLASLQNGAGAAAHLMLEGAFNVNSVSVEAWKAVLSGVRFAVGPAGRTAYRRSLHQPGGYATASTGSGEDAYTGYRLLSDDEIYKAGAPATGLAVELADQVRRRGPFLSLAQFVNRKLVSSTAADAKLGLKGALQTAIDDAGINGGFPAADNYASTADQPDTVDFADPGAALGAKATGIPGWLTQADVLQALGPVLSARSDTFVIRAYGEALNPALPATDARYVQGRAWCEAVVQRTTEPVTRASASPADPGYYEPAAGTATAPSFGRRFRIVSFRWLSPDDI